MKNPLSVLFIVLLWLSLMGLIANYAYRAAEGINIKIKTMDDILNGNN